MLRRHYMAVLCRSQRRAFLLAARRARPEDSDPSGGDGAEEAAGAQPLPVGAGGFGAAAPALPPSSTAAASPAPATPRSLGEQAAAVRIALPDGGGHGEGLARVLRAVEGAAAALMEPPPAF